MTTLDGAQLVPSNSSQSIKALLAALTPPKVVPPGTTQMLLVPNGTVNIDFNGNAATGNSLIVPTVPYITIATDPVRAAQMQLYTNSGATLGVLFSGPQSN